MANNTPQPMTLEAALQQALAHHQAGRLQDAEQFYRAILQAVPNHPDANHNLGIIAVQVGKPELGLPMLKTALEANPKVPQYWLSFVDALMTSRQADAARDVLAQAAAHIGLRSEGAYMNLGLTYTELGRAADAEASYRKALEIQPQYAEAHVNLGALLRDKGALDEAKACFQRALQINPNIAEAHCNMGNIFEAQKSPAEAESSYRKAIEIRPDFLEAHTNLGLIFQGQGKFAEAERCFRKSIELKSDAVPAYLGLGAVLEAQGRGAEAEVVYRKGTEACSDSAELYYRLGIVLQKIERYGEAEYCFLQALKGKADLFDAYTRLAAIYLNQRKYAEAEAKCREALKLDPKNVGAYNTLGAILLETLRLQEAEQVLRQALTIHPDSEDIHNNLAIILQGQGKFSEAVTHYRKATEYKPDFDRAYSNLLLCLTHDDNIGPAALFAEHVRFGEQFEAPLRAAWPKHANSRDPNRMLKVGFVSADFCNHAVANFIEPVLAKLVRDPSLAIYAYYNYEAEDHVTTRFKSMIANWRSVVALSDEEVAKQIQADGIDILIDLSSHTAGHRLLTFARKPAPVQATWIGYAGTTGLQAMDYYLADRHFLPPGRFDEQFTEKIVRLPTGVSFQPAQNSPPLNPLPALSNGYLTFGSFNRLGKLNRQVIALWGQVLRALPTSHMLLGSMPGAGNYSTLLQWLDEEGIARQRLIFHDRTDIHDYLRLHHQVDICLDTFPYNGGTTTLHALWMGVPTLTLAGQTPTGRSGAAGLSHTGLESFIAETKEEFVQRAVEWAGKPQDLAQLRQGLRNRIAGSSMGQSEKVLLDGLTKALRIMWRRWCEGQASVSFEVTEES